jgi:hypothetical protein
MIHYSIWFDLRSDSDHTEDLSAVREFLSGLYAAGSIAGFHILKNSGTAAKTKMLQYQALIVFCDDAQFSAAFSAQAASGIHNGLHGRVMALVSDFRIAVFRQIAASDDSTLTGSFSHYACEI